MVILAAIRDKLQEICGRLEYWQSYLKRAKVACLQGNKSEGSYIEGDGGASVLIRMYVQLSGSLVHWLRLPRGWFLHRPLETVPLLCRYKCWGLSFSRILESSPNIAILKTRANKADDLRVRLQAGRHEARNSTSVFLVLHYSGYQHPILHAHFLCHYGLLIDLNNRFLIKPATSLRSSGRIST